MAINLIKNSKGVYHQEKPRMTGRQKFLLFMAIFMVVITTTVMILGFMLLDATKVNFVLISLLNLVGYLGAFCYYDLYLKTKNKSF